MTRSRRPAATIHPLGPSRSLPLGPDQVRALDAEGRRIVATVVDTPNLRDYIGEALWQLGRHEEAIAEWRRAWGPDSPGVQAYERGFAAGGPQEALLAHAEQMATQASTRPVNPFGNPS